MKHLLTLIALTGTLSLAIAQTAAPAADPAHLRLCNPKDKRPRDRRIGRVSSVPQD